MANKTQQTSGNVTVPEHARKALQAREVGNFLSNYAIIIIISIMVLAVGFSKPNFWTLDNGKNLIINIAPRFIIAAGVSGCLITKGTDLSAGRLVGLSACVAATVLQEVGYGARFFPNMPDLPVIVGLLIAVAITALFGMINGMVIAWLKVPPFIATLGMQTIVYGICQIYTGNDPQGGLKDSYKAVANGSLFGVIPYLFLFALVVGVFMWLLYIIRPGTASICTPSAAMKTRQQSLASTFRPPSSGFTPWPARSTAWPASSWAPRPAALPLLQASDMSWKPLPPVPLAAYPPTAAWAPSPASCLAFWYSRS